MVSSQASILTRVFLVPDRGLQERKESVELRARWFSCRRRWSFGPPGEALFADCRMEVGSVDPVDSSPAGALQRCS